MKWLIPVVLVAVGLCVCVVGLLYGVLAVGVPTLDAPPAVAARKAGDADRAFVLMTAGLAVAALGVLGGAVAGAGWVIRRRAGRGTECRNGPARISILNSAGKIAKLLSAFPRGNAILEAGEILPAGGAPSANGE